VAKPVSPVWLFAMLLSVWGPFVSSTEQSYLYRYASRNTYACCRAHAFFLLFFVCVRKLQGACPEPVQLHGARGLQCGENTSQKAAKKTSSLPCFLFSKNPSCPVHGKGVWSGAVLLPELTWLGLCVLPKVKTVSASRNWPVLRLVFFVWHVNSHKLMSGNGKTIENQQSGRT
jgi:hypothetical protein